MRTWYEIKQCVKNITISSKWDEKPQSPVGGSCTLNLTTTASSWPSHCRFTLSCNNGPEVCVMKKPVQRKRRALCVWAGLTKPKTPVRLNGTRTELISTDCLFAQTFFFIPIKRGISCVISQKARMLLNITYCLNSVTSIFIATFCALQLISNMTTAHLSLLNLIFNDHT